MKVSELTSAQLDYWVARAEGEDLGPEWKQGDDYVMTGGHSGRAPKRYRPSADWAQGGLIVERERITIRPREDEGGPLGWAAHLGSSAAHAISCWGETALIAAMRAYVASRFGEEVPDDTSHAT